MGADSDDQALNRVAVEAMLHAVTVRTLLWNTVQWDNSHRSQNLDGQYVTCRSV
jgi:hypothetical protein